MFCTHCANEVEQFARFCSKCGQEVSSQGQQSTRPGPDMNLHVNILGWLLVGSGVLTGVGGMILLIIGQGLRYMPMAQAEMPPNSLHFASSVISIVVFGILALGAATAAAGVGLLQYRSWARVFATIMAIFLIFHFPIGTIIAIYAFWVLFSKEGQRYYKSRSESTMIASGT